MSEPHKRLDVAMNRRRIELDFTWNELAAAVPISPESLRAIRRGDSRPADLNATRLDRALRWEPGSVLAILDGGDPKERQPERAAEELSGVELDDAAARDIEEIKALLAEWQASNPDRIPQAKRILKALDDAS